MDAEYAARRQQRLHQFQQQQMLHEQNEYAAYFGVQQQSPPMQSPPLYTAQPLYSQNQPSSAYFPYATNCNLPETLSNGGHGLMQEDYSQAHDMIMQQQDQDPWEELAEWYWNLYNHEGLLDPSATQDKARQDSYDSGNSPTNPGVATIEQKPELPEKPFRDQLIHLYFVHVHPLCPVFDEHEFCEVYDASEDGLSVLNQNVITLLELQAMLFAGALHLSTTQLGNTNYTGTHECHKALFKAAKNTYHACQHEDRIAATRAAILLSLWAPYNSDHSNSYWVDQALSNAQAANLSDVSHQPPVIPVGRRKLIWMSCLRRDRYLAFASRRATRLTSSQQNIGMMSITREDYGLEAVQPRFMSLVAKWSSIENFAQQCELSHIMLRLLRFQRVRGFDQGHEWAAAVDGAQLLEAIGIDSQMEAWRSGVRWEFLEGRHMGIGHCDAPIRLTSIQYESAIAFLYLPYIYVRPGVRTAISPEFSAVALEKVKTACSNIARTSEAFVDAANANDIPLSLGAWILLPIVMKLVFLNTSPIHTAASPSTSQPQFAPSHSPSQSYNAAIPSNPSIPSHSRTHSYSNSTTTLTPSPSTDLHEMRTLMTLLYIIKSRYSGGEFVSTLLDTVMNRLNEQRKNRERRGEDRGDLGLLQEAAEIIDRALASRVLVGGGTAE